MPDCTLCGTDLKETECDSRQEWVDYSYICPHCGCYYGRKITYKTQSDMVKSDILYVDVPISKGKFVTKDVEKITDNQRQKLLDHVTECLIVENVCPVAKDKTEKWMGTDMDYQRKFFKATVSEQKIMIDKNIDVLVELYPDIFNGIDMSVYGDMVVAKICKQFRN